MSWKFGLPGNLLAVPLGPNLLPIDPAALNAVPPGQDVFVFVAPEWATLNPRTMELLSPAITARPDVGIFYADDAWLTPTGEQQESYCKPSPNVALLYAEDYIGFPLIIRASVFGIVRPDVTAPDTGC